MDQPVNAAAAPASQGAGPSIITQEMVLEALKPVVDPEIHVGVVDLGLVYGVDIEDCGRKLTVRMTLTSYMCPYGPMLMSQVQEVICSLPGVIEARVALVWEPPWDPRTMASEEAKDILGIW